HTLISRPATHCCDLQRCEPAHSAVDHWLLGEPLRCGPGRSHRLCHALQNPFPGHCPLCIVCSVKIIDFIFNTGATPTSIDANHSRISSSGRHLPLSLAPFRPLE